MPSALDTKDLMPRQASLGVLTPLYTPSRSLEGVGVGARAASVTLNGPAFVENVHHGSWRRPLVSQDARAMGREIARRRSMNRQKGRSRGEAEVLA